MGNNGKCLTSIVDITNDIVLQVKTTCNAETLDLLNDTYRFLFSHHETISESAMHTYYSALPFTPHNTCLYHLYEQETSHSITVLQGLNHTWTSCLSRLFLFGLGWTILSISPDGMWLAVGQHEEIFILDARTTASQCQISLTDSAACFAFSPSESTLVTVTSESLELWNTTTGINQKTQMLRGAQCHEVAFSSQGQYLLLSIGRHLHLHHGTGAGELSVVSIGWCHKTIVFTSNDTQVITGSEEGAIHFFMLSGNSLREILERRIYNNAGIYGLVLLHDGKRLASSGMDGAIRIYDLPSQSPIAILWHPRGKCPIRVMAYHPTEEELVVGYNDDSVVLWRQKETPSDWIPSIHHSHSNTITGIAYCQNGTRMYTRAFGGDIKLWTTMVTQVQEPPKHPSNVDCFAFNRPTSLLATGSVDGSIILWNFTTSDYLKTLVTNGLSIQSLRFSDDGVLLASGTYTFFGPTVVWDVASGSRLHELAPHDGCKYVFAFSEDNAHLTTTSDYESFVWELKSGELLERRQLRSVNEAHATPYYLDDLDRKNRSGWQTVVELSRRKKCKDGLFRSPGEYGIPRRGSPIIGDRAVLLYKNGGVLILDTSRIMDVYTDPARQIEECPGAMMWARVEGGW